MTIQPRKQLQYTLAAITLVTVMTSVSVRADGLGEHGFAQSDGVRIHYVTDGEGPLVVMIHGFPDFWYTWRHQMPQLSKHFQVVAIDQRGYNQSDQPDGVENYAIDRLVADVRAVVRHFDREKAIIVGHDWGGMVAWMFAMQHPDITERLVILNLPHPAGFSRELATNPAQQEASAYARRFQQPDAWKSLTAEGLTFWIKDSEARAKYVEAFERSSFECMLNYYVANYPRPPYREPEQAFPKVQCPTLIIHGLDDTALLPGGHNSVWEHVDNDVTLKMIPGAGHFVQHDAADKVTRTIDQWLRQDDVD